MPSYVGHAAALSRQSGAAPPLVRDLQRDLRALGYLHHGVDGAWGDLTDAAIRALRLDLNDAKDRPQIAAFNTGAVSPDPPAGDASLEPALAACLAALAADPAVAKLAPSAAPASDNRAVWDVFMAIRNAIAPTPVLAAMFRQESGGRHYRVPSGADEDSFITIGLDRNDKSKPARVTSRGYGLGQYTIKHHPPTADDLEEFILDPRNNVATAFAELRDKFDHFVLGRSDAMRADDRLREFPLSGLRTCKYPAADARYMADCRNCAVAARRVDIAPGLPVYAGASLTWAPTQYYPTATYTSVPVRADIGCDWPYALRRYNGGGINSYHYQAKVLLNLKSI